MSDDAAHRAHALALEAETLFRADRLAEAEALYRQAAALEPTATRVYMIATVRMLVGDLDAAQAGFNQALALDPDHGRARATLGLVELAKGRFAEGFAHYDAWRALPELAPKAAPDIGLPIWNGEDVAGKALAVWGEEGFGDQIMYARFAPLLAAAGGDVGFAVHSAMVRLVREGLGFKAAALKPGLRLIGADYVVPLSRLPVVMMRDRATPPDAPYLKPPEPKHVPGARIGLALSGNPEHENDRHRSLPPQVAAELKALPGAISLKPEDTGAADFWDTASVIMGLDLVISVDTSVAHLAGALGKPVWILLPAIGCDWRWGQDRTDSDWYPSARLFRQHAPGDWREVVSEVRAALAAL